jgi:hypothetical protein
MFAIAVFSMVAVVSINLMNSGIATTESSMEQTLARAEIDAQAAALRFIHNGYIAEYEYPEYDNYVPIWNRITARAIDSNDLLQTHDASTCEEIYTSAAFAHNNPFVINTRRLSGSADITEETNIVNALVTPPATPFEPSGLNPRVIFTGTSDSDTELKETGEYRDVARVEGIWITAVKGDVFRPTGVPKYYDFYIRTCWIAPGRNYPTKLGTIIRLYNPQGEYQTEGL